ncbi:MAG: hypothetical protein GY832_04805 [Chloroflexi bacterium]|nr:hypothetical protein [Chloroflexota bacterium]
MNKKTLFILALLTVLVSLVLGACDVEPTQTPSPLAVPDGGIVLTTKASNDVVSALPDWLVALAASVWAMPAVKFLIGQITLNTVVAVAVALNQKTFEWKKLADFLLHKITPYILVYAGAVFLGKASGQTWLATVVMGMLETQLLAGLIENLTVLGITQPAPAV